MNSTGRAALLLGLACGAWSATGAPARAAEEGEFVRPWLQRISDASEQYEEAALRFLCRETIVWEDREPRGVDGGQSFDYIFVHDAAGGFQDYRTKRGGGGAVVPRPVSPSEYGVPRYVRSAYLWIFPFRESRWSVHHYRVLGDGEALGRPAVRIAFEPVPPYLTDVNGWFGTAWFDRETAHLLRVEGWTFEEYAQQQRLEALLAGRGPREESIDVERVTAEFGVEREGLRFPSEVVLRRERFFPRGLPGSGRVKVRLLLEVRQRYAQYQFFSVRTEDERGDEPTPPHDR